MRYMMLIYSQEEAGALTPEEAAEVRNRHWNLIREGTEKGKLVAAQPLSPVSTATTVRIQDGKPMFTDGPFAETKEQLAGYYVFECEDLEEAKQWAAKIPTCCQGRSGCIEIRTMPPLPVQEPEPELASSRHA